MDEHTLNDLLECSVCLERLDTSSKVLPCQHTFCRKCLEVIVSSRQELRCPECRVLVEIKIDDLPPNVLLMRILEGMKNAAVAKSQQQQKMHASKLSPDARHPSDCHQQQKMHNQLQQLQLTQQRQHQYLQPQQPQTQVISISHNTNSSVQQVAQQHFTQQRRCVLPHAYALYDFESSEPSDLHFKKGDLVLLKRKIDTNWYVGQLNNGNGIVSEGTFPINHVQVVVPLPSPQCVALYDFKMPPNEEQGCLTFKKGTIIHVIRRVDHNWAEGCIGSTIGIFPIAFVELNALAKQVLDATYVVANTPTTPSLAPPTADTATVTAVTYTAPPTTIAQKPTPNQVRNPPPMPLPDASNNDSTTSSSSPSNSSSNATSPHSVSTTTITASTNGLTIRGASSTSMPNSPNQSLPASPQHEISSSNIGSGSSSVRFRDKREKRHSLNALLTTGTLHSGLSAGTTLSILQSNRHSAEILSVPTDATTSLNVGSQQTSGSTISVQEGASAMNAAMPQSSFAREQQQHIHQQQQQSQQPQQRVNMLKTSVVQQHLPPTLPWGYLALYPYKPRKSDELELKKGCVYIVIERCLDGWFKGKNWQDITGVFPGNYVTPLRSRDQQQLMHQWKYVPLQNTPFSTQGSATAGPNTSIGVQSQSTVATTGLRIQSLPQPPDLPPRQVSGTLPISSVWTKPLGHTVEAFFNRYGKTHDNSKDQSNKERDNPSRQKENTANVSSTVAPTTASSSTTSSAVQLMKRLAHIKSRSKSPSSAIARQQQKSPQSQLAQDKSLLDDSIQNGNKHAGGNHMQKNNLHNNSAGTQGQLHPIHVRSGSCPSQLLQSLPHDIAVSASTAASSAAMTQIQESVHITPQHLPPQQKHQQQHMQQISPQAVGYGSQQLRGHKERPNLQNARQSVDAATLRSIYNSTLTQQQQQQQQQQKSTNTAKGAGDQQHPLISTNAIISNHRKSHSLDAAAALSGTNSDCETFNGSNVGLAVLAAPCNITAAAVAASATTKSTQCSRESRFRCVVPYPPNSEIELELQVGDIIYVQRRQKNGWYKGTHARTNKTGLFPASFVEPDI
ncbi:E3 ubiquitin-protein ligase SH3RF1 [Anastrepha obliqua]|uniref:E3 ubiquitin-protein ligase SH3RF1 n=1 Tax=Anastrepha obliqua TaxID=95512 RepID=UPI00240905F1|nr:E3 ubiquitin-protein ligase SH3RF1 [Anastrepha obliqua]XP_054737543.1 E3 ubiquitin-protein ligase SH3RF1 [Anastrepha obliqua]XP_054737544.1 E3 ubiquitin-protein ligase SH3RF1 [Anastrepha obliqua]XP_054737546.1 E3 ubiquitin-protein ligase SH3RF1 [Anastrepha obliqua]XP_054737547.1 E3 ubiquitin-protein ligase SH3RF1 [Anastrepha obliqua]